LEILGKIETDNLVARIDAALSFVAALLPDVATTSSTEATCLVAAAVVLPDLKLAAFTAVALTTSTIRVSLVFRFVACPTPSTTAALLSLLAAVIQFSSLWK
jgi:hypothetical protein